MASPIRRPHPYGVRALVLAAAALAGAALPSPGRAQQTAALAGTFKAGPLTLALDSAGGWRISMAGALAVEGAYELRGDTVRLRDTGGPRACGPDPVGAYGWSRVGATLTFRPLGDACSGRQGALARAWTLATTGLQALTGVALVDGTGSPARPGTTVLVENGRIRDIFPDGSKPLPEGAERIELQGRWLIPGLIDTHVHLATDPSGEDARASVLARLRDALYGGVTSVRDMGGDARALAGLARDAALDDIESPSIVYGAIFAGPEFFGDPRVLASSRGVPAGEAPWARAVGPDTDLRLVVAQAKGAGVRALKLYAALPASTVKALVKEAHAQGLLVWGHATLFPARPSELVDAGVDVLSHSALLVWQAAQPLPGYRQRSAANYASVSPSGGAIDDLLRNMAARGTMLDATLWVSTADARAASAGAWAASVTSRARELGVRVCAGTDGMIGNTRGALPNLHSELELLVSRAGFTPLQAIAAATSVAAAALGVRDERGVIAPGLAADLVVLSRDPTADIRNTRSILWVMKHGRRYAAAGT